MKFILIILTFCLSLFAAQINIPFNQGKTIKLNDGDIINLDGFPTGWDYNLINLRIDGISNIATGKLKCENNQKSFSGWSTLLDFSLICGKNTFIYNGPSQSAQIIWWVTQGPESQSFSRINWKEGVNKHKNLGIMNNENVFEFNSQNFIITQFPNWKYNIVKIAIEPNDSKELDGFIYLGSKRRNIKGWYQTFEISENGGMPVVFELIFNQKRNIKVRWWVENAVPTEQKIQARYIESENKYEYQFSESHLVGKNLKLFFNPKDFQDSNIPQIKRLEHNPQNVQYPSPLIEHDNKVSIEVKGPTYEIDAKPISGKSISIALPIPENIRLLGNKKGTISLMHFNKAIGQWEEVFPDSVSADYVYFTTSSFSPWYVRSWNATVSVVKSGWDNTVDFAVDALQAVGTFADTLIDGFVDMYKFITDKLCSLLDIETYTKLVGITFSDDVSWEAPAINFGTSFNNSDGLTATDIQNKFLKNNGVDKDIVQCPNTGSDAEKEKQCFEIGSENIKLLLADQIYSQMTGTIPRFKIDVSKNDQESFKSLSSIGILGGIWNPFKYQIQDKTKTNTIYDLEAVLPMQSTLLTSSYRVLNLLQECDGALGLADEYASTWNHLKGTILGFGGLAQGDLSRQCRNTFGLVGDLVDWVWPDVTSCAAEGASFSSYYETKNLGSYWQPTNALPSRDEHVLAATDFLNNLSILLSTNKDYRNQLGYIASRIRNQLQMFTGLTHDLYNNNNVAIKAMAGIALYDYINTGSLSSYNTLKSWLDNQTESKGGYAEGTGYLMYVNQDVPYVLSALLRLGAITRAELPQNYIKSGEWLWNLSREFTQGCYANEACLKNNPTVQSNTSTLLPVEVDDGIVGYNPDFNVYSYLTQNKKWHNQSGGIFYFNPMQILGNVSPSDFDGQPAASVEPHPDVYFADGAGLIKAQDANGENVYLSIIAESGKMRINGGGHDQQDNGSATLSHASKGAIIVDPGYNGFSDRGNGYARYNDHNVLKLSSTLDANGGQSPNGHTTYLDVAKALAAQPGVHNLDFLATDWDEGAWNYIWKWFVGQFTTVGLYSLTKTTFDIIKDNDADNADFKAGGSDVNSVDIYPKGANPLGAYGIEIEQNLGDYTNRRAAFYFAGQFWIIDRPDVGGSYESSLKRLRTSTSDEPNLKQKEQSLGTHAGKPNILAFDIVAQKNHNIFASKQTISGLDFTEQTCGNSICYSRVDNQSGYEEYVIVPPWGELFDGARAMFGQSVTSGGIILGRRLIGERTVVLKNFGKTFPNNNRISLENLARLQNQSVVVNNAGIGTQLDNGVITWTNLGSYNGALPALQLLKGIK